MKEMDDKHGDFFVGIAVHNNDPMEDGMYDLGLGTLLSGYPSSVVDRGADIDPSDMEADFLQRIVLPPSVTMKLGGKWNENTRVCDLSVTTKIEATIAGNHSLVCVLTEDSVLGTASGYNQSNSYAGGSNGKMGGFELLPSSVPASKMVYDHVARTVSPNFTGLQGAFSSNPAVGATHIHNFTFPISSLWSLNQMKAVCFMTNADGKINNGIASSLNDAIKAGFSQGNQVTGIENPGAPDAKLLVYPNPANDHINISWTKDQNIYEISILSADGRVVLTEQVSASEGMQISTADWIAGVYTIMAKGQNGSMQQIVMKQ